LKILNVIQGTHIGGMEKSSLLLMKEMVSLGHQISLLSLTKLGLLRPYLDQLNIYSTGFPYRGPGGILDLSNYRRVINSRKIDAIMMTGHSLVGMLALIGKNKHPRVLFVHFHHKGVKQTWTWKLIYFIANRIFDNLFFASNFIMEEAIKIYPIIKQKSSYLPNPLPPCNLRAEEDRFSSRVKLNLDKKDIVIGNAGWLIERKRFDILLRVSAEVKKSCPSLKILIAGDGEEKRNLESLAVKLGLSSNVIWLGWQEDLEDFYNSLDVMLFNSDWDAVGLSPLEAIQRGIPTFASVLNGGLKEILTGEFSTFLEQEHNIDNLSNKISNLISNQEKIYELTLKCRDHINNVSQPSKITQQVLSKLTKRGN
jgi:glycosyltransferase involved in cell wall biosynthesis